MNNIKQKLIDKVLFSKLRLNNVMERLNCEIKIFNEMPLAYNLNRLLLDYEAARRISIVRSHPRSLTFLMIDKCNSKCVMCGGAYYSSSSGKFMSFEKYLKILGNLKMNMVHDINYGGAGDPLLNPDLLEIIKYTADKYKHIKLMVITNAINLGEKIAHTLLENNVTILISLNAATRDTYYRLAQVDKFDEVYKNIFRLANLKSQMKSQSIITLSIVISRINIEELVDFIEIAKRLGNVSVGIYYCRFYPERFRSKDFDIEANRLRDEDSLFFHQELSNTFIMKAKKLAEKYCIYMTNEPLFGEKVVPKPCANPWKTMFVGYDGEVYTCAASEILFKDKVEKGIYKSGNILKEGIDNIWNNEFHINLRKTNSGNGAPIIKECACCSNSLQWMGPDYIKFHILDWDEALKSKP